MLATDAGKQLSELIDYVNLSTSEIVRALRGGLTFQENFNAKVINVDVIDDTATLINSDGRVPSMIFLGRIFSGIKADEFGWNVGTDGSVSVRVKFSPTATGAQRVTLLIIF